MTPLFRKQRDGFKQTVFLFEIYIFDNVTDEKKVAKGILDLANKSTKI